MVPNLIPSKIMQSICPLKPTSIRVQSAQNSWRGQLRVRQRQLFPRESNKKRGNAGQSAAEWERSEQKAPVPVPTQRFMASELARRPSSHRAGSSHRSTLGPSIAVSMESWGEAAIWSHPYASDRGRKTPACKGPQYFQFKPISVTVKMLLK